MKIHLHFNLPVSFIKENNKFVAYTPALDLSTSGDTFEQTKKRFEEIVNIFFEEIIEKGTLDEVLSGYGWTKINKDWSPPINVAQENVPICIGG